MARKRKRRSREKGERPRFGKGPRPAWSGTLSFGLVSVPVDLFPASRDVRTPLRMLAPDGAPLSRRYVCSEEGRELARDELVRGYEVDEGEFVVLDDEELEAVEPRKSRDIELRQFVDADELEPFLFERAYVLTPAGESAKPYRLLAEVMQVEGKAGIATFVLRGKKYLAAIHAREGVLWAETLRFADEVRAPEDVGLDPGEGRAPRAAVQAWVHAIDALAADALAPDELRNEFHARLSARVEAKRSADEDLVDAPDDVIEPEEAAGEDGEDAGPPPDLLDVIRRGLAGRRSRVPTQAGRAAGKRTSGDAGGKQGAGKKGRAKAGGGDEHDGLEDLSKDELYARAQEAEVEGRSRMTKAELVTELRRRG